MDSADALSEYNAFCEKAEKKKNDICLTEWQKHNMLPFTTEPLIIHTLVSFFSHPVSLLLFLSYVFSIILVLFCFLICCLVLLQLYRLCSIFCLWGYVFNYIFILL